MVFLNRQFVFHNKLATIAMNSVYGSENS